MDGIDSERLLHGDADRRMQKRCFKAHFLAPSNFFN
jgi:hypothetical protein